MSHFVARSLWGMSGQGLSSASSLVLAIMVSRESAPSEVGAWAVGYALYTFVLAITRNVVSTPTLITAHSNQDQAQKPTGPISASLTVGIIAGFALLVSASLISGPTRAFIVIFSLALPILLCVDGFRYWFIRTQRPQIMAAMDLLWLTFQILLGILAIRAGHGGATITASWVVAAATALTLALIVAFTVPTFRAALEFFKTNRQASSTFFLDSIISSAAANGLPPMLGVILGLTATGYFRGGLTIIGVAGIAVMGLAPIATVELARRRHSRPRVDLHFLLLWSAGMFAFGLAFSVITTHLPENLGKAVLGETWYGTAQILLPLSLQLALRGPLIAVPIVLRVSRRYPWLIAGRIISGVSILTATISGAYFWALPGAAWGWLAGTTASTLGYLTIFLLSQTARDPNDNALGDIKEGASCCDSSDGGAPASA